MATVDKPLTQPRVTDTPRMAPPTIKPPRPFFLRSWLTLVIVVVIVLAHIAGWRIAQIQPELLISHWPDLQRRFGELLQPDIVSQDQKQLAISMPIVGVETPPTTLTEGKFEGDIQPIIKKGGSVDTTPEDNAQNETFKVVMTTPTDKVTPGQKLTITAEGLRPSTPGNILWQSTGTNAFTQVIGNFTADAQGKVAVDVNVPSEPDRVMNSFGFPNTLALTQNWNFGNLYFSPTLVGKDGVLEKIVETIFLALMGTTIAIFISLPISFIAARNLMPHTFFGTLIYTLARTFLNVMRSIEALILATIFAATVGLGPFAGVLALIVFSIASLGKFYSEAIEAIDPGPIEAITATGANRLQVIAYAVIPQFIPQFISFTMYTWDRNVRASTIIGFVGGGGIGFILVQYINLGDYHKAATAVWAIAIVVIIMDWVSARVRRKVI